VVLPFTMPPREKTRAWKGRLLLGGWLTFTSRDWVVIVLREARGTGILARKGEDREVILGAGYPHGLGSKERNDLDDIAPCDLGGEGLKPDSRDGSGGKSLSDDALGDVMPCHLPWLPLETDLGGGRKSLPPRSGYNGPRRICPESESAGGNDSFSLTSNSPPSTSITSLGAQSV
jgi:hypothetical protein